MSSNPPRWRPRGLRRQLVLGVSAVVTVVFVAVGAVSVLSLRTYVTAMSDADLYESLNAFSRYFADYRHVDNVVGPDGRSNIGQAMLGFSDQTPGNVLAVLRDGAVIGAVVFTKQNPYPAPADVVAAIAERPWAGGPPQTVELGSLGSYRVATRAVDDDDLLFIGGSLDLANRTVERRLAAAAALYTLALLITAGLTIIVVSYALRPLRRVAATAASVAAMPLTDSDERITVRVDDSDVDPENEVGIVAGALNRLLDNVDSALAYRSDADRRMRQFITDASHELRTPLAAIHGYAELTRQDSSTLPRTTEYALARIESEAQRMSSLVEELLLLSRLGEGQDLRLEDVDLVDLVLDAVNDAAAAAPSHHWIKDLPAIPVWVRGDRARLHQVVTNLLKNAWVHNPPGVTITTAITEDRAGVGGPTAELTVANDGPGIDAEMLPHLFERFVRGDKARSGHLGSTGLGLAIVASIVDAHRGSVGAESHEGWTVFRVRLPMANPPP
ncbi:sensor histidine kinase [Mycolicibacter longobardus]|uniref:histidine kinase n=1 Tax=Mycolicibacter longobardus TaxID=1108812 RepID=A0A1X1YAA2_9MYCO|nr:HAMP domain-containing sensor histidine kinase [Mycolicibacter longobardus]MCV7385691.1 HAMP domain-containing histidine kinase [Mycolicibacter longobardus]ORW07944.1 histidine kinase [Mycolicibacter longobardus]